MEEQGIKIAAADGTWIVRAGNSIIGKSKNALKLEEEGYDPVIYFPAGDIGLSHLAASPTVYKCPQKGIAHHYCVQTQHEMLEDVAWSYSGSIEPLAHIQGHVAFHPDKVEVAQI